MSEYVIARSAVCDQNHIQPCMTCQPLLKVATTVVQNGFCTLRYAFNLTSNAAYDTEIAKRKLLQMPLAAIRIGKPCSGTSLTLLIEHNPSIDFQKMSIIINAMFESTPTRAKGLEKLVVKEILNFAQSDREREMICCAIFMASNITLTQDWLQYGFENMTARVAELDKSISEAQKIRAAINELAAVRDKACLASLGIITDESNDSSSEDSTSSETELQEDLHSDDFPTVVANKSLSDSIGLQGLKTMMRECQYNWFEILEKLE